MDVRESIEGKTGRDQAPLGLTLPQSATPRSPLAFAVALVLHALVVLCFLGLSRLPSAFPSDPTVTVARPPSPPVRVVFYETRAEKPAAPPPETDVASDRSSRARSEVPPLILSTSRLPAAAGQSDERRPEVAAPPAPARRRQGDEGSAAAPQQPEPFSIARATERPDAGLSPARTLISPSLAAGGEGAGVTEPAGGRFGSGALTSAIRQQGFENPASAVTETGGLEFDAKDFEWGSYARKIYAIVDRNWKSVIPLAARMPGVTGKVKVRFRIRRDGKVTGLELLQACGRTALDQAALASIELSDPLPALPAEFPRDDVGVTFGYFYNLPLESE